MIKVFILSFALISMGFNLSAQSPGAFGQLTTKTIKVGGGTDNNTYNGSKSTVFGPDSTSTTKFAAIRAITNWANDRLAQMFNYINATVNTPDTIFLDPTLRYNANRLGVNPNRMITLDTLLVTIIRGGSTAPAIQSGTGGGTSPTVSVVGTDLAGEVTIIAGTSPTLGQPIVGVQFSRPYSSVPYVLITPSNQNAGTITGSFVYSPRTTTGFYVASNITNVVAGTTYKWTYQVMQ